MTRQHWFVCEFSSRGRDDNYNLGVSTMFRAWYISRQNGLKVKANRGPPLQQASPDSGTMQTYFLVLYINSHTPRAWDLPEAMWVTLIRTQSLRSITVGKEADVQPIVLALYPWRQCISIWKPMFSYPPFAFVYLPPVLAMHCHHQSQAICIAHIFKLSETTTRPRKDCTR